MDPSPLPAVAPKEQPGPRASVPRGEAWGGQVHIVPETPSPTQQVSGCWDPWRWGGCAAGACARYQAVRSKLPRSFGLIINLSIRVHYLLVSSAGEGGAGAAVQEEAWGSGCRPT